MDDLTLAANWSQILSLLVAVIAIAVSVWLYRRSRKRRALACEFQSIEFPIEVKAGEAYGGDIEIRFRDNPIENLFLVRTRLKNTGNMPIRESEVIQPVTFEFDSDSEVLLPTISDRRPENLRTHWRNGKISLNFDPRVWPLNFDLLNPDDEVTAEFLCTGKVAIPKVAARIEGISEIGVLDPTEIEKQKEIAKQRRTILAGTLFIMAAFIMHGTSSWIFRSGTLFEDPLPPFLIFGLALALGSGLLHLGKVAALARYRKRKRESSV